MHRILSGIREAVDAGPKFSTEGIAKGQSPEVLLVTCSDSRVVPHLVTSSGPGDIFVVRNAGNMLPEPGSGSSEEATIEYGIRVLRIPHLIVCGHTHCGAMQGLLSGVALPAVNAWLKSADEARDRLNGRAQGPHAVQAAVEENVVLQLERARRFPCVAEALAEGTLTLHGWIYDIETTGFHEYDDRTSSFVPLMGESRPM